MRYPIHASNNSKKSYTSENLRFSSVVLIVITLKKDVEATGEKITKYIQNEV